MTTTTEETSRSKDTQRDIYLKCVQMQLDEFDLLSSIFCSPGEIHMYDATVVSDFHDYISGLVDSLHIQLDFGIFLKRENDSKVEIHIELPHLYPLIENANVSLRSSLLHKSNEAFVKKEIEKYVASMDKSEGYAFQVINWIQDRLDDFLQSTHETESGNDALNRVQNVDLERLWIYSHHIKSKTKRHEIVKTARELDLTGFSRPGKPGVICVEGLKENTQEFWKIIKSMHWQKITVKTTESKQKQISDVGKWRRFSSFNEEIFTDIGDEGEVQMDMSLFMKFLDAHNCSYIKKDLFGFD